MTAEELIAAAVACADCGKEHEYWQASECRWTWASKKDGHNYRPRLYVMTGGPAGLVIEALRRLASGG